LTGPGQRVASRSGSIVTPVRRCTRAEQRFINGADEGAAAIPAITCSACRTARGGAWSKLRIVRAAVRRIEYQRKGLGRRIVTVKVHVDAAGLRKHANTGPVRFARERHALAAMRHRVKVATRGSASGDGTRRAPNVRFRLTVPTRRAKPACRDGWRCEDRLAVPLITSLVHDYHAIADVAHDAQIG
jgi:hypothetical protein